MFNHIPISEFYQKFQFVNKCYIDHKDYNCSHPFFKKLDAFTHNFSDSTDGQ